MILIVDDVPEIVELLATAIRGRGYYSDAARDAISAVYKMERIYYALAFIDISLDGSGSGNDVARQVKALPEPTCLIPLVAMTGSDVSVEPDLFCHVIRKPFLISDLWSIIDEHARPPIPDIHPDSKGT